MKIGYWLSGLLLCQSVWAVDFFYCPQRSGYIKIGMNASQVIAACGQPLSKQQMNTPVMQKVPMLQILYNNEGNRTVFYGVWSMPIGNGNKGLFQPFGGDSGGGARLEINVINDKVSSILLNSSTVNAFSICQGQSVEIGDPVSKVYSACGTPSLVNKTYINQAVPSQTPPEVWVYQPSEYQSPLSLTFVDGKLQSIH